MGHHFLQLDTHGHWIVARFTTSHTWPVVEAVVDSTLSRALSGSGKCVASSFTALPARMVTKCVAPFRSRFVTSVAALEL